MVRFERRLTITFHIEIPNPDSQANVESALKDLQPRVLKMADEWNEKTKIMKIKRVTYRNINKDEEYFILFIEIEELFQEIDEITGLEQEIQSIIRDNTKYSRAKVVLTNIHYW